jgi:hypothetical protein
VPNATVTTEVHQALYIHRNIPAQIAFNFELRDCAPEIRNLRLSEIFHH